MRILQYILAFMGVFFLSFIEMRAQTVVTLEECHRDALAYNKSLDLSRMDLDYAETAIKAARTAFFPKVDGSASVMFLPDFEGVSFSGFTLPTTEEALAGNFAGTSGVDVPGFDLGMNDLKIYMGGITVEQPIYVGSRIRLAHQMAEIGADMAGEALNLTRAEVIHGTDRAFWSLMAVQEQVLVLENHVEALDSLEDQLKVQYELGIAPRSEMLKVSVMRNEAKLRLVEVTNLLDLTGMNLARLTGRPLDEPLRAAANTQENIEPRMQLTSTTDFSLRPELQILKHQQEISRLERLSVKGEYLPRIGVSFGYQYLHVPDLISGSWTMTLGAGVSIPLIHWRERKFRTDMARINEMKREINYDDTRNLIALEVQQNQMNLKSGVKRIELAQMNLEQAEETMSEVEISFRAGLNSVTDLLNARVAYQRAAASLIEAQANLEIITSAYLKSVGLL
ncbi:TolC family protein [Geofilum rubicundum]|uniref:Outer membrane efflux protein n=1 Tax=Geofilum rubicundum JCM 15548 TaxID=1236989 RepID=A0A0E9LPY1_9BACT|nr:TolC family protein [Geofilum rubicundum]GAO27652.1 outer membrane efflux protein [Geofilum rubicundum JCM 15548]